jgi:hypothetical protein
MEADSNTCIGKINIAIINRVARYRALVVDDKKLSDDLHQLVDMTDRSAFEFDRLVLANPSRRQTVTSLLARAGVTITWVDPRDYLLLGDLHENV